MRKHFPTVAAVLIISGSILIGDHFLFTKPCEARSADHIRFVLGPCMVVTDRGVEEAQ